MWCCDLPHKIKLTVPSCSLFTNPTTISLRCARIMSLCFVSKTAESHLLVRLLNTGLLLEGTGRRNHTINKTLVPVVCPLGTLGKQYFCLVKDLKLFMCTSEGLGLASVEGNSPPQTRLNVCQRAFPIIPLASFLYVNIRKSLIVTSCESMTKKRRY